MCTNPGVVGISKKTGSRVFKKNFFDYQKGSKFDLDNPSVVPCNKCLACRKAKALEWSVRMVAESKLWRNKYFITLTYSDEYLPFVKTNGLVSGDVNEKIVSVNSYDVKKFMQRLKRYVGGVNNCSYFYSAEYGTKTARPHYHIIFFTNKEIPIYEINRPKVNALRGLNEKILNYWDGKGHCLIAKADTSSMFYVGQYTLKKLGNDEGFLFKKSNRKREYISMSKKTPLGFNYFIENRYLIFNNKFYVNENVPSISIPKSFIKFGKKHNLFTVEEQEYLETIEKKEFSYYFKQLKKENLNFVENKNKEKNKNKKWVL